MVYVSAHVQMDILIALEFVNCVAIHAASAIRKLKIAQVVICRMCYQAFLVSLNVLSPNSKKIINAFLAWLLAELVPIQIFVFHVS